MYVIGPTFGARDCYYHLPTLETWVRADDFPGGESKVYEMHSRANTAVAALKALPAGDNPYADCSVRVGYDPLSDEPFFIRKVDKGYIYVASWHTLNWKLN